jgi:RNA polymerase sigma-70 factor (ECF subfamily)
MNEPADVELMLSVKRGDREAFRVLIGRHQKSLLNFIYRFTGNPGESEDLTQEVFLKMFQAAPRYEPQAGFTTWLYRIATNVTLNYLRDHKPHLQALLNQDLEEHSGNYLEIQDPMPLIEERLLEEERIQKVQNAVAALPENQRLAVILTKYQNLSLKETAVVLKCSPEAVKSLIFRAYVQLRGKLAPMIREVA